MNGETLRVEVRFKNARLFDAIMEHAIPVFGAKSAAGESCKVRGRVYAFCEFYDFQPTHVYDLLNLRKGPFGKIRGGEIRLREVCQRLSAILEKDPEWLFPQSLYEATWRPIAGYLSDVRVQQVLAPTQEHLIHARELISTVKQVMGDLPQRDRRVIEMRFGLDGKGERSLDEVGDELGVTRERIRQLEARGLRKLRHPVRTRRLRQFLKQ